MAQVFCIGAARLSGHVEDTTARESQFVFPADVRMGTAGQGLALNDHNLATALARGLAALILYYVGVVGLENCDGLREYNAMDTIFQGMVSSYQPKYVKAESFRGFSKTVWDKRGREKFRTTMEKITRYVDDAVSDIGAPLPSVINVLTQHLHSGLSMMHGNRIKDE